MRTRTITITIVASLLLGYLANPAASAADVWSGTVGLTTTKSSYTANEAAPTVRATISPALTTGYTLSVYDNLGDRKCSTSTYGATNCNFAASLPINTTRSYTAYVTYGNPPATGGVTGDIRATSGTLSVTNLGYVNGSITLTTAKASYTANEAAPTVRATISPALTTGYTLSVYDNLGDRKCSTSTYGATNCNFAASLPINTTRSYTAYVTYGNPPATGGVTGDIRAFTRAVSVTKYAIDTTAQVNALAAAAAAMIDPCIELFPVAPPSSDSSLNQAQKQCESARATGVAWTEVFSQLATTFGVGIIVAATVAVHDGGAHPKPALDPSPPVFDPNYVIGGATRLLARIRPAWAVSADPAPEVSGEYVFRQCIRLAAHVGSGINQDDCETLPIFAPGADIPDVAQHDFDVTIATPSTVQLTAVTTDEKSQTVPDRGWYRDSDHPEYSVFCKYPISPNACDEHPYYTTEEGGPGPGGSLLPHQLRTVDGLQNSREGSLLNTFYSACGITATPRHDPGRRYLVIPMPQQTTVPTLAYCGTK